MVESAGMQPDALGFSHPGPAHRPVQKVFAEAAADETGEQAEVGDLDVPFRLGVQLEVARGSAIDLPTTQGVPIQAARTLPGTTNVRRWRLSTTAPRSRAPVPTKRFETQPTPGSSKRATVRATSSAETRTFESETRKRSPRATRAAATSRDGGRLWVRGVSHGPTRKTVRSGRAVAFTAADGLCDNVIFQILSDDRGRLWMNTSRGICASVRCEASSSAPDHRRPATSSQSVPELSDMSEGTKSGSIRTTCLARCSTTPSG